MAAFLVGAVAQRRMAMPGGLVDDPVESRLGDSEGCVCAILQTLGHNSFHSNPPNNRAGGSVIGTYFF